MYLLSGTELTEEQRENLNLTDRRALFTWSGEDLRKLLEKKYKLSEEKLMEVVLMVEEYLQECDCFMCIDACLSAALDKAGIENEKEKEVEL